MTFFELILITLVVVLFFGVLALWHLLRTMQAGFNELIKGMEAIVTELHRGRGSRGE